MNLPGSRRTNPGQRTGGRPVALVRPAENAHRPGAGRGSGVEVSVRQRVLVFGDDAKAFLAVVRSLGRAGLEVHAAPTDLTAPALRSRYIARVHRLPAWTGDGAGWARALADLADAERLDWIVPTSDSSLAMLARQADRLGRDRLALPGPRAEALLTDKAETRRLAFECGVPVCRGRLLTEEDDAPSLARAFGLPLVLKPRRSWAPGDVEGKKPARIVRDVDTLGATLGEGLAGTWLAESFFAGVGIGVSVLARGGEIMAAIQHRRLEEEHETGPSTRRVTEPLDPQLLGWVSDLAAAAALNGVAMFEFRRDARTGEHVLLEVNPRFWGSLPLAVAAGVDFPALLHAVREGASPAPQFEYQVGRTQTDLIGEYCRLSWRFGTARTPFGRVAALLRAVAHAPLLLDFRAFDSWADDDPDPWLAERRQVLANARDALRRRLPGRRSGRMAASLRESSR